MKYNYIIIASYYDYYRILYHDIIHLPNVCYRDKPSDNRIMRRLFREHMSIRNNSIFNLPFKDIWARKLIRSPFKDNSNLCFIVFYNWIYLNVGILETIKRMYPNAKTVVVFNDLVRINNMRFTNEPIDVEKVKSQSDLVLTFDFDEAEKYGMVYRSLPFSIPQPGTHGRPGDSDRSDVYFIGEAKNRLQEIMKAFYKLKSRGLKLKFILAHVPDEERIEDDEITYIDTRCVTYRENLDNVRNTECLLEIIQKESNGYTLRTLEAIAFGKRLISNNESLKNAPFYNPGLIAVTETFEDLPSDFIQAIKDNESVDYKYLNELSPIKLLEFIESSFMETDGKP